MTVTFTTNTTDFPAMEDETVLELFFTYQPEYVQSIPLCCQETPDDPAELWLDQVQNDTTIVPITSFTPAQINELRQACWNRIDKLTNPDPY